jgi:triosephosphate isomerase
MLRKPVIAGNWKMYKTRSQVSETLSALRREVDGYDDVEVVVCPPFTSLSVAHDVLEGSTIKLGAQNAHWDDEGAYTGEISTAMLLDCGCSHVILGHSERRQLFNESNVLVARRLEKVIQTPLIPILCVGETLEDRDAGRVEEVVLGQMEASLAQLTADSISRMIVAYEPVWAIGTGRTATPETAQQVHRMIRDWIARKYARAVSDGFRILYGGSVKSANIAELMSQTDIDGALVGGASLDALSFAKIVRF